ncbi:MAG TPA: OmpA family protein [Rhodanobacteraceae bacterium]|nr:OmpA family protein [Rhodanobacteraceae bacterium]
MTTSKTLCALAVGATLFLGACATVPPGPPPDVVRLQSDLDRLHSDPRIANNAGPELANADAAVDVLARNARVLDARAYTQGVYIADRLVGIAEATALARYAEQRGTELGVERERLLTRSDVGTTTIVTTDATPAVVRSDITPSAPVVRETIRDDGVALVPRERAELVAMQQQMPGVESRLDARGLIVHLDNYSFEPSRAELTPTAEQSLDGVARVLASDGDAGITVEAFGSDGLATARAASVRDYLDARGVDGARIASRTVGFREGLARNDRRVDIVIQGDYR